VVEEVVGDGLGEQKDRTEQRGAVGAGGEIAGFGIDAKGALALERAVAGARVAFFGNDPSGDDCLLYTSDAADE